MYYYFKREVVFTSKDLSKLDFKVNNFLKGDLESSFQNTYYVVSYIDYSNVIHKYIHWSDSTRIHVPCLLQTTNMHLNSKSCKYINVNGEKKLNGIVGKTLNIQIQFFKYSLNTWFGPMCTLGKFAEILLSLIIPIEYKECQRIRKK